MTLNEIHDQITPVFRKVFGDPVLIVQPEHSAADFPQWDSINHVILIARVEKLFGIKISTAELINLKTVGDLMSLIQTKKN